MITNSDGLTTYIIVGRVNSEENLTTMTVRAKGPLMAERRAKELLAPSRFTTVSIKERLPNVYE